MIVLNLSDQGYWPDEKQQSMANMPQALCVKHEQVHVGTSASVKQNLQNDGFTNRIESQGSMPTYGNYGDMSTCMVKCS